MKRTANIRVFAVLGAALVSACGSIETTDRVAAGSQDTQAPIYEMSPLAAEVASTYYALRPSVGAQAGFNILNNRLLNDAVEPCMTAKGFELDRSELVVDKELVAALGAAKNSSGVDARWASPPDPIGAANGLGLAGPVDVGFETQTESTYGVALGDDELELYGVAYDECVEKIGTPTAFDRLAYEEILAQYHLTGSVAQSMPAFAELEKGYTDCMAAAGYEFQAPEQILDSVKTAYAKRDAEDAAKYERAVAVADANCRLPLFSQYIDLNPAGWRTWLDKSASQRESIEADLQRLEAAAG